MYLSPLNLRTIRNIIRKNGEYNDLVENPNPSLRNFFHKQLSGNHGLSKIDTSEYDIVFITSGSQNFIEKEDKIKIELINFDEQRDYKASLLKKQITPNIREDMGHIISLNKCGEYTVVNTTYAPFNKYHINSFVPGSNKIFYTDENQNLIETDANFITTKKEGYYTANYIPQTIFKKTFDNIHMFSNRQTLAKKVYKNINGGNSNTSRQISRNSECFGTQFQHNDRDFCWFSSIVNSFFFQTTYPLYFSTKASDIWTKP